MALAAIQLARHDQWLDELQGWALVLNSPSLPALFHNLGYEGHPGLWYTLLWFLSLVTTDVEMPKVLHWAVAAASIALVGYASPFRRRDRILLMAGYFLAYQYVVVTRNYAIAMLMAFLYAFLEARSPERKKTLYLLLGLLANCTAFSFFLSAALVASRLVAAVSSFGAARLQALKDEAPGLFLYALFAGLFVWTVYPPPDMRYSLVGVHDPNLYSLSSLVETAWTFAFSFYSRGIEAHMMAHPYGQHIYPVAKYLLALIYITVFVMPLIAFYRSYIHFFAYATTTALSILFCFIMFRESDVRHSGILWVSFVVCYWGIYSRARPSPLVSSLVTACLVFQAFLGILSNAASLKTPYSNSTAVASWIRDHHLTDKPWIAHPDHIKLPLFAYLGITPYSPGCNCRRGYILWNTSLGRLSLDEAVERMVENLPPDPEQEAYLIVAPASWPEVEKKLAARGVKAEHLVTIDQAKRDQAVLARLGRASRDGAGQDGK